MNTSDLSVFVYGTLKPGGLYWPEFCAGKAEHPTPAKIRGQLYDLHLGYPGLRLEGMSWVKGYRLTFKTEKDFLRLDDLEGYAANRPAENNEYIRRKVPCFNLQGETLGDVWAYEVTESTLAECQGTLIPEGNWPL